MKKVLLLCMMLITAAAFSQTPQQDEKIIVSTKDLPPGFVEQLKTKQTLETYGKWAGVGKEVGIAVRDGLTAVKDVSVDFSNTKLGTYTMILIAYKVVGDRILAIVMGIPLMIVITVWALWSYRKTCLPHSVMIENPGLFKYPKKYAPVAPLYPDGGGAILHFICWGISMGIMFAIIFNVG